jgi:DNA repair exonuclease SbcCD ATPase subunit
MGLFSQKNEMERLRSTLESGISQIRSEFTNSLQRLEGAINQNQQSRMSTELFQLQAHMQRIQQQVSEIHTLISHTSPLLPSGEPKAIHDAIKAHALKVSGAMDELEKAHSEWLEKHLQDLQNTLTAASSIQKQLEASVNHIDPAATNGTKVDKA